MNPVTAYLQLHWLALALLAVAAPLLGHALWRRRAGGGLLFGAALALVGLGGLGGLPPAFGFVALVAALCVLLALFIVVVSTGWWSAWLGYALAALLLLGFGAAAGPSLTAGFNDAWLFVSTLEALEPGWLLLLLLVPVLAWYSWRRLTPLGPIRRWVALGLRCLLIVFIALALAEAHARRPDRSLAVLFLWDRSLSVPPDYRGDIDQRAERLRDFINEAVARRPPGHESDQVGLIVFGRRPRLELPPGVVPKLNLRKIYSPVDGSHTDIAAAIKLALASFPEGTGKRIVLLSDGNENLGHAEEQARLARQNGVEIDVVPLAIERKQSNEVLVERIEAPAQTEKDARVPLRVVIRSHNPHVVVGTLHLDRRALDKTDQAILAPPVTVASAKVALKTGLNVYYFQQSGPKENDAFTYVARFVPSFVRDADGRKLADGLPGDRVENNRASVSVTARGQRAVLLLEPEPGMHQLLVDRLRIASKGLKVVALALDSQAAEHKEGKQPAPAPAGRLPENPAELALVLSRFDTIILANLPADTLTEEQQKVIRSHVHDQGAGLIMIGGNQSFGAGSWQGTEVEKALPVTMDLKSMKVEGKSGLVLMMHASEMAEGNAWQRKIAKLAIEKLSPMDMVGMLYYSHGNPGGHQWHIKFQVVGANRGKILNRVQTMEPGDMPDVDPAFAKAYSELTRAEYALGTKHIIFISDGDHWNASRQMLTKLKRAKITCTTVCITTHGQNEVRKMQAVAQFTGGRSYYIKNPRELPAIYVKESRLVSQSFVHQGKFQPHLNAARGPTEGIQKLEPLFGFVRTTRRPGPLVEVPIESPKLGEYTFPILAQWQYGLGKGIAFTSDARTQPGGRGYWDRDWANSDLYTRFWEQTVLWSLRPTESGKYLRLNTELRDGKVRVIVEARNPDKTPITDVEDLRAGITVPSFRGPEGRKVGLKFEQKAAGLYEAEFPAEEVGTYFINIQARWRRGKERIADAVRAGVTVPYSPEYAEMESNPSLLDKLAEVTGGQRYAEDERTLRRVADAGELFRPVTSSLPSLQALWPWLVLLTALCLVLDVAVRRVAVSPEAVWAKAVALWARLRGREAPEQPAEFLERLKGRKAQVGETIDRTRTGRKFEGATEGPAPVVASAAPTAAPPVVPKPEKPPAGIAPKKEEEADYAARLLRAKRRAMEERDKKDKPPP